MMKTPVEAEAEEHLDSEGFGYGFVVTYQTGVQWCYIRNDRAILDWMFEPINEDQFIDGVATIDLPDGYFYWREVFKGDGPKPYGVNMEKATNQVSIGQENPVQDKAWIAITGLREVGRDVIEAANLPIDKIFYIDLYT